MIKFNNNWKIVTKMWSLKWWLQESAKVTNLNNNPKLIKLLSIVTKDKLFNKIIEKNN